MEFLTIHELAQMSGVSTATIRLDIRAGRIPIATPGKRGRGNPTLIRVEDLESSDRIQYQQLAQRIMQGESINIEEPEIDNGKFSVNELANRAGLSPQVVRKDILDGKLKAEGGGRRGSPYFILIENLKNAGRIEYRRIFEKSQNTDEEAIQFLKNEIAFLKNEIEFIKNRMRGDATNAATIMEFSEPDSSEPNILQISVAEIELPKVFEGYYVSEERLKQLKSKLRNSESLDPIQVCSTLAGTYMLRRGIAQYHLAREVGLSSLPAYVESPKE